MRLAWVVMAMSMAAQAAPPATAADGRIRVQLMSRHAVTLSSEIPAKISAMPVVEGGGFRRGQPLVEFDCSSYRAQLRKAQASLEAASQLLKVNNQLAKYNSVGTLELTQAQGKANKVSESSQVARARPRKRPPTPATRRRWCPNAASPRPSTAGWPSAARRCTST